MSAENGERIAGRKVGRVKRDERKGKRGEREGERGEKRWKLEKRE